MGQLQEVRLPDIGETDGVNVIEVLVSPGDVVAVDDSLIALESDKASMEVPSTVAGKVVEVKAAVDQPVSENMVIAVIETDETDDARGEAPEKSKKDEKKKEVDEEKKEVDEKKEEKDEKKEEKDEGIEKGDDEVRDSEKEGEEREAEGEAPEKPEPPPAADKVVDEVAFKKAHASPAVRRLARELGVDLSRIRGSGRKNRITKDDVRDYVKTSLKEMQSGAAAGGIAGISVPAMPEVDFSKFGPVEEKSLARIRKLSAKNLHRSWLHVPHVTQHEEADVTELEEFRKAHAGEAEKMGFKLTPVAFLLKATAATLKAFPDVNSSLAPSGESLILKKYYHIGVAVDTADGLVVPVIRDVDQKGVFELAEELVEASRRAREGKLTPKDFQGASFTISSLGGIGGTAFTPIVNAPEVAILGASRNYMKPVWKDGEFVPRLMLPLSLSYDHRVVDGAMAARFVVHLARLLSDLRRLVL